MADDWTPARGLRPVYEGIQQLLGGVSLAFATMGDGHCYGIIATRGEMVARAWTNLAARDPNVRKFFERLMVGGTWGETIFATAAVVIPIAQHHGAPQFNTPFSTPPESPEVQAAKAAAEAAQAAGGMKQPTAQETPSAADLAEQQRKAAEARRARG